MIQLPPGCTVTYSVWVDIDQMTDEVTDWFRLIGGTVTEKTYVNFRGREVKAKYVQYGKAKPCHHKQDGSGGVRLHFHGDDASVASMFMIKFAELVERHNLREVQERYNRDHVVQEQLD